MTGRYPFRYGLQKCIPPGSVAAVPLSDRTLPELLKASAANYTTVALGKWCVRYLPETRPLPPPSPPRLIALRLEASFCFPLPVNTSL